MEELNNSRNRKVIVYGTNSCSHCNEAKQFLDENKIKYDYINLLDKKNEKIVDNLVDKEGMISVPIIEIDGHKIVGFDRDELLCKLDIDRNKCKLLV